jgi:hypothetical protein
MKKIPFYIGVLLVIPLAVEAERQKRTSLYNGYGVGSIMAADMAILHESIKENIQQQALLVWMDAQGKRASLQAAQAIDALINNIRYVSIENTWYKIIREVSRTSLLRKAIAGAGAIMVRQNEVRSAAATQRQGAYPGHLPVPAAGAELPLAVSDEQQKVVVTAFACEDELNTDLNDPLPVDREMAMVIERYQSMSS